MKNSQTRPGRFPWIPALAILVLVLVVARMASSDKGFDWKRFILSFQELDPGWGCMAILFILLSYLGRAIRWQAMMRPLGSQIGIYRLLVDTIIGFTSVVLLGRPGEFVRPWLIARDSQTAFSSQIAIWLLERVYDLLVVICFFGFGLIHLAGSPRLEQAQPQLRLALESGGVLALAGGAACLVFLLVLRFLSAEHRHAILLWLDRLPETFRSRLRPPAESFLEGAVASCSPQVQGLVLAYTVIEWGVIASCFYSIFQSFEATRSFTLADAVTVNGLVALGSIIQLPGIGGGMQVAAVAVLTQLYGIGLEEAASLALLMWGVSFLLIVPVGIVLGLREGIALKTLRNIEEKAL